MSVSFLRLAVLYRKVNITLSSRPIFRLPFFLSLSAIDRDCLSSRPPLLRFRFVTLRFPCSNPLNHHFYLRLFIPLLTTRWIEETPSKTTTITLECVSANLRQFVRMPGWGYQDNLFLIFLPSCLIRDVQLSPTGCARNRRHFASLTCGFPLGSIFAYPRHLFHPSYEKHCQVRICSSVGCMAAGQLNTRGLKPIRFPIRVATRNGR